MPDILKIWGNMPRVLLAGTGGCSASPMLYCPDQPNTRGQMAVFLTITFGLQ